MSERSRFRIGDITVHPDRCAIVRDGKEISLRPLTMNLLVKLAHYDRQVVSRDLLLEDVWKNKDLDDNPINRAFNELRKKLGDDANNPLYIKTVRNGGYRLIPPAVFEKDYRSFRKQERSWLNGSPFVGLTAFDETYANVFFGRDRMREKVLRGMRAQFESGSRFVLLHGASGSGKTSLLNAGVIPKLTKPVSVEDLRALAVARCDLASAQSSDAIGALATALATWKLDDQPVFPPELINDLKNFLIETPESIERVIDEAFQRHPDREAAEHPLAHLLLVIDHGEKLVDAAPADASAHERFARALTALCGSERTLAVMIVRGDFYQKLQDALPELMELKGSQGHIDVVRPTPREIAEMIDAPAECAGLDFERDPQTGDYLDYRLCEDAQGPDVLPLLQHTLRQLYDKRDQEKNLLTFAAYREMGGLEGGIAHRAQEVFASLPPEVQASLDDVLSLLVEVQDTGVVSGRQSSFDSLDTNALALVEAFSAARLFVSSQDDRRHRRFGVTHEALLRQWPLASDWAKENHRLLRVKAHFKIAATRWNKDGRSHDHLLNSGRPLIDATDAVRKLSGDLEEHERDFLEESTRFFLRKRRIRRSAIASLALLTLASISMAMLTQSANRKARARYAETQGHLSYIVGELVEKIDPTDNIELLESIGLRAIQHYQKQPISEMHTSDLVNYSRALNTMGEVRRKQGDKAIAAHYFALSAEKSGLAIHIDNENSNAWFELSQSVFYLGQLKFESGTLDHEKYAEADTKWRQYLSISRMFTKKNPNDIRWLREESFALNNLGSSALRRNSPEKAEYYFSSSTRMKEIVSGLDEDNLNYQFDLIDSKSWIYSAMEAQGNLDEASRGFDQAITDLNKIIDNKNNANKWKFRLANYYFLSANAHLKLGDFSISRERADEGVKIISRLASLDPGNKEWEESLLKGHSIISSITSEEKTSVSSPKPQTTHE